jgi:hypothetical protein
MEKLRPPFVAATGQQVQRAVEKRFAPNHPSGQTLAKEGK